MDERSVQTKVALAIIAFSNLMIGLGFAMKFNSSCGLDTSSRLVGAMMLISGITGLLLTVVGLVEFRSLRGISGNLARGLCLGNGIMVFAFVFLLSIGCVQ